MPWLTPFSVAVGVFALVLFGYLAAVYLTLEARTADERAAFRARALVSGVIVAVLAALVLALSTPAVRDALIASPWAIPLHIATGAAALTAFAMLWSEHYAVARIAAAAQVSFILWGWAAAQYPYAIRPHLTLAGRVGTAARPGAAPRGARRRCRCLAPVTVLSIPHLRAARISKRGDVAALSLRLRSTIGRSAALPGCSATWQA